MSKTLSTIQTYEFEKSESLAPKGYKFLCNCSKSDKLQIKRYIEQNCIILDEAYSDDGERIHNKIAIYKKDRLI